MNQLVKFIKGKLRQMRLDRLPVPEATSAVDITRTLQSPRNILIVPYDRMGTTLLATRTFKSIRERYPEAKIAVAVHTAWSVLIQNDPTIDEVITYGDEINDPFSPEFMALGKSLATRRFDLAFFLSYQYNLGPAYLTRLSEATLRVSFQTGERQEFFNIQLAASPEAQYEGTRYLELLGALGIPGILRDYTMTIGAPIREKARLKFLSGADSRTSTFVGFDLTREIVGEPITRKQAEATVGGIISECDATVIVFFEHGKREIAAALKEMFGKRVMPVEDRPVSAVAGLMSFCSFIVARNTDLFQLSTALKIPVLAILSQNDMRQWSPGESERIVHVECSSFSWPSAAIISQSAKQFLRSQRPLASQNAQN